MGSLSLQIVKVKVMIEKASVNKAEHFDHSTSSSERLSFLGDEVFASTICLVPHTSL